MRVWFPFILALSLLGFAIAPVGSSAAVLGGLRLRAPDPRRVPVLQVMPAERYAG